MTLVVEEKVHAPEDGDSGTKYGSVRAGLGHPEPFGLEYIASDRK